MLNKEFFDKILSKFKNKKKLKLIIIFLIVSITVLLGYTYFIEKKSNNEEVDNIEIYIENIESKLTSIIEKIDGAGKTKVMLTIDSGIEQVLATNTTIKESSTGTTTEESPILVNGKTVVIKEQFPKIIGAVIVCEGANNLKVVNSIINATTSLLSIESEKVQIIKMK